MDDIARQARQGSVAAIIQILNQKLAPDEVRTRAVFSGNILQLLCEAAEEEKLERNKIIDRVREILEAISPRGIRRVNINCRLVREQQLLWLEEINRDPDNQLLWSEQIVLAKPNIIKRLLEDARNRPKEQSKQAFAPAEIAADRQVRQSNQLWHGFLWGAAAMLAIVAAWGFYRQSLGPIASGKVVEPKRSLPASAPATTPAATPAATPATKAPEAPAPDQSTENFARAVRLAQQAVEEGKLAKNADDWLVIAANWDQASKLMASVSQEHPEYATAQNRAALYRRYSQNTQAKAEKLRKTQNK
ncbi:MAG: hypothetical protein F6J93_04080 [Oscillatoria sp. SIO1A7]|nr:hypothetical protein [Oscillatoria sp. SIO1A7]